MTTWLELLAALHTELKPRCYLEVGVHGVFNGASFRLADPTAFAIGIDPAPSAFTPPEKHQLFQMTSDDYFQYMADEELNIDFAFIDGSHLFEDALRDFINIEQHSHKQTVVVFDDILPMSQEMASRTMVPGYWTGDVWKMHLILSQYRKDLKIFLVDTEPTGTMIVLNTNSADEILPLAYSTMVDYFMNMDEVPSYILNRAGAYAAEDAIQLLKMELE